MEDPGGLSGGRRRTRALAAGAGIDAATNGCIMERERASPKSEPALRAGRAGPQPPMTQPPDPAPDRPEDGAALVHAWALRGFGDLVAGLGGEAGPLLAALRLDPELLGNPRALLPYRSLVHLLERAAEELDCPDLGMRLATWQAEAAVLGPLGIAMHNSRTVGEALRYWAGHAHVYSTATGVSLVEAGPGGRVLLRLEILLARLPHRRQAVEQALVLCHRNVLRMSAGRVRARELWFEHEPLAAPSAYRRHCGAVARFGRSVNALAFAARDLEQPIADRDPQIYKLAASFVERRFPPSEPPLGARVRSIVERLLREGDCSLPGVASKLGLHPRTLQRRLRADGDSFEEIKDGVRRDVALRYIEQSSLPLMRVAEILGYSETSVLSRSCTRWFSASPRQLRRARARRAPGQARISR